MSSILEMWVKLPHAKQMQLSKQYSIRYYGTTEAQLIFELQTKLPQGLLKEEVIVEKPAKEVKAEKPAKPAKEVKAKKKSK